MTPTATSRPAAAISARMLDLGHLAVGELEDELVDAEAEHRLEDGPVRPAGERAAQVVPEAQVRADPDASDDGLDDGVEQRREVRAGASGWIAGDGSSIWIQPAPASASAASSARRIGTNAAAAAFRSG